MGEATQSEQAVEKPADEFEEAGHREAFVDTTLPADDRYPGKITEVGFFNEKRELQ